MYKLLINPLVCAKSCSKSYAHLRKLTAVPIHVLNSFPILANGRNMSGNVSLDLEVNRIVWIDIEMTGLDVDRDKIMEIASLITDSDLNIIAEGPEVIIHQSEEILSNMNEWCKNQHGKSGLTQLCSKSTTTLEEAENVCLDFISKHVAQKCSPLAGNSVYMDRMFLLKHMPKVHEYLHYRIIDVSTIKEICRRWNSNVYNSIPKKEFTHRALLDIKESVEELKFYKSNFLKLS